MKLVTTSLSLLASICFIFILLITSVEAVAYWTPGYFEKEYAKYQVPQSVSMEMDDLLYVTDEMMSYLKGSRDNLHITTTVDGVQREFFNQREISHMEDVQHLFLAAISLRRIASAAILLILLLLYLSKAPIKTTLAKAFCICCGIFISLTVLLGAIIATDFTKYFTYFHLIFFDNDLWILDPRTDLLINIVPEPFFMDTALRIGLTFFISVLITLIICFLVLKKKSISKKVN